MKAIHIDALRPGTVFVYQGPPRGLLRKRGIAPGRVLGVDAGSGIVYLRTLLEREDGALDVDIGFMPVLFSKFRESVATMGGVAPVPHDSWAAMSIWREKYAREEAGAFSCEIWEAERLAWSTVREGDEAATRESSYIEYAFPSKSTQGVYDIVVASVVARNVSKVANQTEIERT